MLLKAVFLVATGIFTRPKDPVTQELRHFSVDNTDDAGRNFDEDIFMAVGSHADLSTTYGPSARGDSASQDVNASDPAGRAASLLQGLSLASVEAASVEQAEAVQETETTAGAQDNDEVEGLLETAQKETASEAMRGSCIHHQMPNPQHTALIAKKKKADPVWKKGGGDAKADHTDLQSRITSMEDTGKAMIDVLGVCCLQPTTEDEIIEEEKKAKDGTLTKTQKTITLTIYKSDSCTCMENGWCSAVGGITTRFNGGTYFLEDKKGKRTVMNMHSSIACNGCKDLV